MPFKLIYLNGNVINYYLIDKINIQYVETSTFFLDVKCKPVTYCLFILDCYHSYDCITLLININIPIYVKYIDFNVQSIIMI